MDLVLELYCACAAGSLIISSRKRNSVVAVHCSQLVAEHVGTQCGERRPNVGRECVGSVNQSEFHMPGGCGAPYIPLIEALCCCPCTAVY